MLGNNHQQSQVHTVHQNKQSFSMSSASLSSSFSSSAASSMLLPAVPPSISSQSDILTSDHSTSSPSATFKSLPGGPAPSLPPPSSPPTSSMGQVYSRPQVPAASFSPSPVPSTLGGSGSSTGFRFGRAFVGRRKKTEVIGSSSASSHKSGKGKEPQSSDGSSIQVASGRHQLGAKQLTLQLASHVFSKKHSASSPASPATSLAPPPLPPKPGQSYPSSRLAPVNTNVDKRISIITTSSPSLAPALDFLRRAEEPGDLTASKENDRKDNEKLDAKEIRRKSDSTMSHHTIRAGFGTRTPRPVSMAESLQSTHTVVPVNKRLSAFLTEPENSMPEEEDTEKTDDKEHTSFKSRSSRRTSPNSSVKIRNRRSQSLSLGPPLALMLSAPEVAHPSLSLEAIPSTGARSVSEERERPAVSREGAMTTFASLPSSSGRPAGLGGRLNFAASTDSRASSPSPRVERTLPDLPQSPRRSPLAPQSVQSPPTFRQTAISMTSGFAPAAGLARRAVEKMGRVWGVKNSGSNSGQTASSPVGPGPTSFSAARGPVSRASSSNSEPHQHSKKQRHTPQAPSGSWSINSAGSSSLSDSEGLSMSAAGPFLGKRFRGAMRPTPTGAGVAGGLVFRRDLKTCVRDTAIDAVRSTIRARRFEDNGNGIEDGVTRSEPSAVLESRQLPALVVRCAQHIRTWGVQELGLFRVSGRSSHVARLRAEFDTGADYDIAQCNPGDLDPHAVASVFKAYLRELPEPILTNELTRFFEAAMSSERIANNAHEAAQGTKVSPSSPKNGLPALRKPPSLSTLAMPTFAGPHPPSEALRRSLSSLISRLPQENRDLLLTVIELINMTANRSQETKMPLSNLLLVLHPSLNMNPSLLQALCESEGIWDGVQVPVSGLPAVAEPDDAAMYDGDSPAPEAEDEMVREEGNDDTPVNGQRPLEKAAEEISCVEDLNLVQDDNRFARPLPEVPASEGRDGGHRNLPASVYMDCISGVHTTSQSSIPADSSYTSEAETPAPTNSSETSPSFTPTDDSSSVSHMSENRPSTPTSVVFKLTNPYSPPSLTSSAESLSTPSMSSASPMHSSKHLPLGDDYSKSQASDSPHSPIIDDESIHLPLPGSPRRSLYDQQFQFPTTGEINPRTSIIHQKSTPSLPSPSHADVPRSNSLASRARRLKKPSLHLLFHKGSASPMSPGSRSPAVTSAASTSVQSPFLQAQSRPSSASDSSPGSMVTAPQSSRYSFPPVLNTAIDSSSISLALGIEEDEETSDDDVGTVSKDHMLSSAQRTPPITAALATQTSPGGLQSSPLRSAGSDMSYCHLDIDLADDGEFEEGDWTQSVLLAAGSEGRWH
ncbi:RhoGAP-domain-containing protein [Leucogyrophana mollusca]|uniref:RhoGAP-domain-containing protein n=1 Tax=Leucogyrophana mollusca TaxID=85980 RepID=A0ACB8BRM6_9AGAM|nr:RhoGAP-domain-containing protein [Leucogyrophana mollusca]